MRGGRSFFRVGERGGEEESVLMGLKWNKMVSDYFKGVLYYFLSGYDHAHKF